MDALAHLLNETNNLELRQTFINHSVVVARTQEGTLVRKIDALEVFNIPDMEMLIGAFAWQHKCNEMIEGQLQPVLKWRFTVDEGKHTFRHYDFAIPVKVTYRSAPFEVGDFSSSKYFPKIGSLYNGPCFEYMYIVPRELVDHADLKKFDSSVLWFFSNDQSPQDSVAYNPTGSHPSYQQYLPQRLDGCKVTPTYALCSHRVDCLMTYNGIIPIENNKKIELGKWYVCQYNPKIVQKCCSIQPHGGQPVQTHTHKYTDPIDGKQKTLVLCRDFVKIPFVTVNRFKEDIQIVQHPLLHKIHVPLYCGFAQKEVVEVCFARPQYTRFRDNDWQIVAVSRGSNNLYWLPELSPQFEGILQKEAFPFIKTLNKMEAEHYYQFYKDSNGHFSFDLVNIKRADWFKNFPEKDVKKEEQELVINDSFLENSVSPVEELVIEYPTASVNTGPRKTTGVIELF